ncbi:MAG: serine hydrolase domain-containing protein [Pseudomonadota bacterium]
MRLNIMKISAACFGSVLGLGACSGGSSPPATPAVAAPLAPQTPNLDFSDVQAAVDASSIEDMAIMVGDQTGVLFRYEKGTFTTDQAVSIASASKMAFGLLIWDMVDSGDLSRDDTPQNYIDFWTDIAGDGRSEITLEQLMGFTSGFNNPPDDAGCIGLGTISLSDCVEDIYNDGLDTLAGEVFYYGPEHMQIAALMAVEATGMTSADLLQERLVGPFGLSAATRYPAAQGDNPRYSGAMISTAEDYALWLTAILDGRLISDTPGYLEDRTANVTFGFRPAGLDTLDWHYGFGFWKECDDLSYTAACDSNPTISSPGAFGFTPWIDFNSGYWGIIAMEEARINGRSAASVSVELEQELQPLIEVAFNR